MTPKAIARLLCSAFAIWVAATPGVNAQNSEELVRPYLTAHLRVLVEGTRHLNLYCVGRGSPTVLFDGGGGASTAVWRFVQGPVGAATKACSYDRAGFGFSDPPNGPADAQAAVQDIHRLLKAAKIATPVIYVGHSLAGLFGVLLQATYPDDVLAEVLIDPSFANQDFANWATLSEAKRKIWLKPDYDFVASMKKCADTSGPVPNECVISQSDPTPAEGALAELDRQQASRRSFLNTLVSEYESFLPKQGTMDRSVDQRQVEDARARFGHKSLIILTRDKSPSYWRAGHDKLASLSTAGSNTVISDSTHSMINEKPKPVIDAVLDIVQKLRSR